MCGLWERSVGRAAKPPAARGARRANAHWVGPVEIRERPETGDGSYPTTYCVRSTILRCARCIGYRASHHAFHTSKLSIDTSIDHFRMNPLSSHRGSQRMSARVFSSFAQSARLPTTHTLLISSSRGGLFKASGSRWRAHAKQDTARRGRCAASLATKQRRSNQQVHLRCWPTHTTAIMRPIETPPITLPEALSTERSDRSGRSTAEAPHGDTGRAW